MEWEDSSYLMGNDMSKNTIINRSFYFYLKGVYLMLLMKTQKYYI